MIEKEKIEAIKNGVNLKAYIESKGIALKKHGNGYIGLCPFHNDNNPSFSVTPSKNIWHCFGCGKSGNVIQFVQELDNIDFKAAVEQLSGNGDTPKTPKSSASQKKKQSQRQIILPAKLIKIFKRVIEYYHKSFIEDPKAKEYLAGRGITDNATFSSFKVGFANGTLLNVLPGDGDIIEQLKEIGILNEKGTEHFYGCVTFPLYDHSNKPVGIYGRRINGMGNNLSASHLYLPGPRHGIFNWQAAKSHKEIILTEAIIDAVTLYNRGIKNTIPCYGTNGFITEHLSLFKKYEVKSIYICFDADGSGRKATGAISTQLQAEGIKAHPITLPEGEDINSFFSLTANAKDRFKELLSQATPTTVKTVKKEKESYVATEYGFSVTINDRKYEIRGITKGDTKLKATVKGIKKEKSKNRLHIDTVDFYSARSRAFLIKGLSDLFGEDAAAIIEDVERLLELVEGYKRQEESSADKVEITPEDKKAALKFLKNPNMFDEILIDFETIGYTGEEMNKLLCYIAVISRKMDDPLSVMIQSRSAAGKSFLQDTVLSLVPESDYVKYTRLTDQALFYKDSHSLAHKLLAIEELDGMNGAIYSIRSIQSSKKITIAYTGKDPVTGKMRTEENSVEGPLMVFITTTQVDIDGETASRFVFISIDESEEMTQKILDKQREAHTMEGMLKKLKSTSIIKKHKVANQMLRPLHVLNPYADLLTFTSKSLRVRRDHTKYLNLILTITYLFQYQRKVRTMDYNGKSIEYINVTLKDITMGNEIAGDVLGRALDELTPSSRKLLGLIREMGNEAYHEKDTTNNTNNTNKQYRFNRRDIREYSGWSDFQIRTHIKQLEELEYIYSVSGKRGKEYIYELVYTGGGEDGKPFLIGLIDIKQLKKKAKDAGVID